MGRNARKRELQILVDNGVRVLDVIVEHALYGEMRGSLTIESRADVQDFLRRWRSTKASLLSSLTRGVHLHTVEASKPEMITRAKTELQKHGFLLKLTQQAAETAANMLRPGRDATAEQCSEATLHLENPAYLRSVTRTLWDELMSFRHRLRRPDGGCASSGQSTCEREDIGQRIRRCSGGR